MKQRFISKLRSWVETETTGYTTTAATTSNTVTLDPGSAVTYYHTTYRPWVHFVANNEKECRRLKLDDFDIKISEGVVYVMKNGFTVSPFELSSEQFEKIKQELTLEKLK